MNNQFQLTGATVRGKNHRLTDANNQDAWHIAMNDEAIACAVCDGCGSEPHSEVGAKLGVRWVTEALLNHADLYSPANQTADRQTHETDRNFWTLVQNTVLARMSLLAKHLGGSFDEIIEKHFLFTIVGAILTDCGTTFFAVGDGLIAINGETETLQPMSGNQPLYLGYALSPRKYILPVKLMFRVIRTLPTEEVQSFCLGTDGANDLLANADRNLPGKNEPLGPLAQFWDEDRYFANPDALRRRLFLANREVRHVDWLKRAIVADNGLLPDDTTLIAGRRKKENSQ